MELEMDCLTSRLQVSVIHQSMCIFRAGIWSPSDGWAKYKEKVPDVSDSNQNVETTCNSKFKFTELKRFINEKGTETIVTDDLWAILKFQIFSWIYHFRLWVFALTGEYFCCWHWRVLPKLLTGKWCQDLEKPCSIILRFVLTNHIYIEDWLI